MAVENETNETNKSDGPGEGGSSSTTSQFQSTAVLTVIEKVSIEVTFQKLKVNSVISI